MFLLIPKDMLDLIIALAIASRSIDNVIKTARALMETCKCLRSRIYDSKAIWNQVYSALGHEPCSDVHEMRTKALKPFVIIRSRLFTEGQYWKQYKLFHHTSYFTIYLYDCLKTVAMHDCCIRHVRRYFVTKDYIFVITNADELSVYHASAHKTIELDSSVPWPLVDFSTDKIMNIDDNRDGILLSYRTDDKFLVYLLRRDDQWSIHLVYVHRGSMPTIHTLLYNSFCVNFVCHSNSRIGYKVPDAYYHVNSGTADIDINISRSFRSSSIVVKVFERNQLLYSRKIRNDAIECYQSKFIVDGPFLNDMFTGNMILTCSSNINNVFFKNGLYYLCVDK